jgi:hypothetical protein
MLYLPFNVPARQIIGGPENLYIGLKPSEVSHAKKLVADWGINGSVDFGPSQGSEYYAAATWKSSRSEDELFIGDPRQRFFDCKFRYVGSPKIDNISVPSQITIEGYGQGKVSSVATLRLKSASREIAPGDLLVPSDLIKKGMLVSYGSEDLKTTAGVIFDPAQGSLEHQAEAQIKVNRLISSGTAALAPSGSASSGRVAWIPLTLALAFAAVAVVLLLASVRKRPA